MLVPEGAELLALIQKEIGDPRRAGRAATKRHDLAQPGGPQSGQERMIFRRVEPPAGRVGEPAESDAASRSGKAGRVPGERDTERALSQRLAEFGDDLRGSVLQAVEDPQQARADVLARRAACGRLVPAEPEQVVALVDREVQSLRDRRDHLLRWLRPGPALETGVVVRRHVAEPRDLFASETLGPATLTARRGRRPRAAAPHDGGGGTPPSRLGRSPSHLSFGYCYVPTARARRAPLTDDPPVPRRAPATEGCGEARSPHQ